MSLVLVAHGTRKQQGVEMVGDIADRVSASLGRRVRVSFVDVLGPSPSEVLAQLPDEPVVLVPAFLSRGYHVTSDIPAHVEASGHPDVTVTEALGPGPQLVRVLADRLVESGWRRDDSVILAAAGTSDRGAERDLHTMATWLSAVTGSRVELAFAATGTPRVADVEADASSSHRTCCRRGCFRIGCGPAAPSWCPNRWACIPDWCG
jgi:sirohydrochlorin ferrochelatase